MISLIELAEDTYPYVSLDRVRLLARSDSAQPGSTRGLARWMRWAVGEGLLLTDTRLRLRRNGSFEPIQIYRLNRRHPLVAQALEARPESPCPTQPDDRQAGAAPSADG